MQRYADPTQDLDFVVREARLQDPKNRQNSIEVHDVNLQLTMGRNAKSNKRSPLQVCLHLGS